MDRRGVVLGLLLALLLTLRPMKLKAGVTTDTLSPAMKRALPLIESAYIDEGLEFWITSANDGQHKQGSKHYTNEAIDAGTKFRLTGVQYPSTVKERLAARIRQNLGSDYDVVVESDHIHVEHDPK